MKLMIEVKSVMPDVRKLPNYVPVITKKAMDRTGQKMVQIIKERIRKRVAPALKAATVKKKRRLGYKYPRTPLRALGILYRAIYHYKRKLSGITESVFVGIRQRGKPDRRWLGMIHQEGMGRMPRRRFFYISGSDWDTNIKFIWKNWFDEYKTALKARKTEVKRY